MKATGIVRRVDDLGRIIIPKEVRKKMKIRDGTPLELFIEDEAVCFVKYNPYNEEDWFKAKKIISPVISSFAILDGSGDCAVSVGIKVKSEEDASSREGLAIVPVTSCGDTLAYLVVEKGCDKAQAELAAKILRNFLEEEE